MNEPTPPDFSAQIGYEETAEATRAKIRKCFDDFCAEGSTWGRATDFPQHRVIRCDGWKVRPKIEAPAEPWLVRA